MSFAPDIEELLGGGGSPLPAVASPRAVDLAARGDVELMAAMGLDAYEGAGTSGRQLAMWSPNLSSADGEILPEKGILDARTRDSVRNDAYVAGADNTRKDSIVGSLYALNSKPNIRVLGLDEVWETEFQEEVEEKFTLAAEGMDCWLDAAGRMTLTDQVRLALGVDMRGGEVVATAEWIRDEPGRPFKTAVQFIDADRLCNPDFQPVSEFLRGGVEMNRRGKAIAYHFREAHPYDYFDAYGKAYKWKRIEARKPWGRPQVIHLFDQQRAGQTRGVSELATALGETRMGKHFRKVVLQNAVLNASYAASIESELPTEQIFARLAGASDEAMYAKVLNGYFGAYLKQVGAFAAGSKNLHVDGVKIPHLLPGTKLQLRPVANGGPLGTEFEQSLLRYLAAALGISYEQLAHDFSSTNYSSARAALNETWKGMMARKRRVADRFASIVFRLWLEEMINKGEITSMSRKAPSIYEGMNLAAYSACEWIGASRGQIDELKETQAAVLRLKFGLSTREYELARLGMDWRKVNRQAAREKADEQNKGLVFADNDKSMNAASGSPREKGDDE